LKAKLISKKKITSLIICSFLLFLLPIAFSRPIRNLDGPSGRAPTVQQIRNKHGTREVIVDNGIISVSFSSPQGLITGIKYKGVNNVLHPHQRAREYFVPEPYKNTMNPLYLNHTDKFRQYGLWQRYTELYPNHDLIYTIGVSNYSKDWFYSQVTRKIGDSTYTPTTWQTVFHLPYVNMRGSYTLQLALASAAWANLQVRFNNEYTRPFFSTGYIGRDNAIARHGIHGLYRLYSINVPGRLLRTGTNTIYLRQAKASGPLEGVMYDYIRLEEPSRE